jgi:WD40 repeat protein
MTVKERNQLVQSFIDAMADEKTTSQQYLELLLLIEKVDFKTSVSRRTVFCRFLVDFIAHPYTDSDEIRELAAKVFVKHAKQEHSADMIYEWSFFRTPLFEDIFRNHKPLFPNPKFLATEEYLEGHFPYEVTGAVLLAFKLNYTDWLKSFVADNNFSDFATLFAIAMTDGDSYIAQRAVEYCHTLTEANKHLLHNILARDFSDRDGAIDWLVHYKYYSKHYSYSKVVVSLLTGEFDAVNKHKFSLVRHLVRIIQQNIYSERNLPEKAKEALLHLDMNAGDSLCTQLVQLIANNGNYKELEAIAIQAGYEPIAPTDKALFFFLTGQFDKYDVLDFDRRLMRNIHETADNNLRRQIGQIVRSSGRTDYLEILNKGQQEVSNRLAYGEQKTTIQILRSNGRWDAIWQKIFELPFWGSVSALGVLQKADWQPDSNYERELFVTLSNLLRAGLPSNRPFNTLLRAGILRAQVKVAGRVNELAFAPDGRRLALATGNRKVIIWNLAQSAVEQTLSDFEASVGLVAYMPEGTLIWAERSNRADYAAGIWLWDGREKRRLGSVAGVATRLQPLNGGEFLVLNATGQPQVWSIVTGRAVSVAQNFVIPATPDKTVLGGKWLLSYSADRKITFRNAAKERLTGTLRLPGEKLTVLEVSADGDLLAAVTEPTGFQLWDLRPLELLELLDQPFGAADTRYMAAVRLLKDTPHITQPVRNALTYIETILRHRFRHAIEIEFAPHLQPGAADIELEILDE